MSTATSPRSGSRTTYGRSAGLTSGLAARGRDVRVVGLRLVGPVRIKARKAPFVAVLIAVVAAGLVGLVLLSTTMQTQAFKITDLQRQASVLAAERDQAASEVASLSNPAALADRALEVGMVPNANPVFLRLTDGRVIGDPEPAEAGTNVRRAD